jgi:hypothetical protein
LRAASPALSQPGPSTPGLLVPVAGVIGLILGIAGTLLARRVRPARRGEGLVVEG